MEKLLKPDEAADTLGISISLLMKWVKERRIKYIRLTRKTIRFSPSDIQMVIAARTVRPLKEREYRNNKITELM